MRPRTWFGLRARLVSLVLLTALPTLGFGIFTAYLAYVSEQARADDSALNLARSLAVSVGRELQSSIASLQTLADAPSLTNGDFEAFRARAEPFAARHPDAGLIVTRADGQQVFNVRVPAGEPLPMRARPDLTAHTFALGAPQISDLFVGVLSHVPIVSIDVPVVRDGRVIYDLSLTPRATRFQSVLEAVRPPVGGQLGIVDGAGVVVARIPPANFIGTHVTPAAQRVLDTHAEAVVRLPNLAGVPSVTGYAPIPDTGWTMVVGIPATNIDGPFRRVLTLAATGSAVLLILSICAVTRVARTITRPIGVLRDMAAGDDVKPEAATRTSIAEVARVAQALRDAAARRHAAERARDQQAQRASRLLSLVPDAIVEFDARGRPVFANPATATMLRLPKLDPAQGAPVWPPEIAAIGQELLRDGAIEEREIPVRRADGSQAVLAVRGVPVRDAAGTVTGGIAAFADVTERVDTESALRMSEARLQAIYDAVPVGIVFADAPSGRIVSGNRRTEEIVGHPVILSPDATSYGEQWIAFHADGARVASHEYPLARMLAGEHRPEIEVHYQRGDGTRRWMRILGAPMLAADGALMGAVVALLDIDRERRDAERLRLLVNELNHRVKNTLLIVQSIADRTLRDVPADRRAALAERLSALAAAHDVLTTEGWSGADIAEIAAGALAPYTEPGRPRISCAGPPFRLRPAAAVALSIALNELATNASKYGALSADTGRVTVQWSTGEGRFHLLWREAGGPTVCPPLRRGFGSRLLERGLASDLAGTVSLEFAPEGVICTIDTAMADVAPQ